MLPEDDLSRDVTIARPDADSTLPHVAVVGNVYTVLVSAKQSAGRYAVIDMFVPPGGGPPPHRHDFERTQKGSRLIPTGGRWFGPRYRFTRHDIAGIRR